MPAFTLIQALTSSDTFGFWDPPNGAPVERLARRLDRWFDRHGAAVGAAVVLLSFVGTIELVRYAAALL